MMGSPTDRASMAVSPPAFSTKASLAAMSPGMSSVHPSTRPPGIRLSRSRSRSSRPHTTMGTKRPWEAPAGDAPPLDAPRLEAIVRNVPATGPTPHDPDTMSTARSSSDSPSWRRAAARSWGWAKRGDTMGPVAMLGRPLLASAKPAGRGCTARLRSIPGWIQKG